MTDQQQHPITPPPELIEQWFQDWDWRDDGPPCNEAVVIKAAQWGWQQRDASVPGELQQARDEELEECCEWLVANDWKAVHKHLRAARRPQPKSLAEEALLAIDTAVADDRLSPAVAHAVRRALERLQELEGQGDD